MPRGGRAPTWSDHAGTSNGCDAEHTGHSRAGLLSAIIHGVLAARHLLRLTYLADASPEQIIDLLRPCFQGLTTEREGR
ncbi:hypothetical protein [Micromonospora sp. NPDC005710]|uniref:TetR/AcrR family transcriptional regulator n=1 Tax=Micromonospora sp. NPDC005710 TaxID=3157051 RepID=UPI0033D33E10